MFRAVLDTNLFISYLMAGGKTISRIIDGWKAGEFVYVTSPALFSELEEVVKRPRFRNYMRSNPRLLLFAVLRKAEFVSGKLELSGICRDPKDDMFIACAIEGNADYLVSGDKDLLDIGEYQGVRIIRPVDFVVILENLPKT